MADKEGTPEARGWSTRNLVLVLVGLLAIVAVGFGIYVFASGGPTDEQLAEAEDTAEIAAQYQEEAGACDATFEEFLEAAGKLDADIDAGMAFNEYQEEVADVAGTWNNVDDGDVSTRCEKLVQNDLQVFMSKHLSASGLWLLCINDDSVSDCDFLSDPLNNRWIAAFQAYEDAKDGLNQMEDDAEDAQTEATEAQEVVDNA